MSLTKYRCHKEVEAGKISGIVKSYDPEDPSAKLVLDGDAVIEVGGGYMTKHNPRPGGYYVRYADGYESFSPAEAFEAGYTAVDAHLEIKQELRNGLRQKYVLAALASMPANFAHTPENVARVAYDRADALMAEFDRRPNARLPEGRP